MVPGGMVCALEGLAAALPSICQMQDAPTHSDSQNTAQALPHISWDSTLPPHREHPSVRDASGRRERELEQETEVGLLQLLQAHVQMPR